jgi:threonine aldolase
MPVIDLRSDTVTQPTPNMRHSMAQAKVGDDVFGEDPTVNELEAISAERMGKEGALFVPSGTMANLVSLLAHCGRGDEVILGDQCHTYMYEQGGISALGGIHPRALPNLPDGRIDLHAIENAIRPDNVHFPRTRVICLENTHNRCYGYPLDTDYLGSVRKLADRFGLKLHIDGARIFNASVALGVGVRKLAAPADSISFCLSKGLAAPVGSVVCGTRPFIAEARRARKAVGGGMRQAGVLAAAGIVALDQMVDRLADDHANARKLSDGLSGVKGLRVEPERVKTNIVYIDVEHNGLTGGELVDRMKGESVLVLATAPFRLRAVTNYHVTSRDIDTVLDAFRKVMNR